MKELLTWVRRPVHVLLHMVYVAGGVLEEKVLGTVCDEDEAAREQVEEDTAETEDIGLIAVAAFCEYFRRHIAWSTALMLKQLILRGECRQTHVCDPNLVVSLLFNRLDEDVVRLDVAVHDLLLLEEVHGKQALLHDDPHLGFRELFLLK